MLRCTAGENIHDFWKVIEGICLFSSEEYEEIYGGFFNLNKQKANKNATNLGITVTTNTDKKQQNKEKKKTELFAWG